MKEDGTPELSDKTLCPVCEKIWFKIGVEIPNSDMRACTKNCVERACKRMGISRPELVEV